MFDLPIEAKALLTYAITQGVKALFKLFGKEFSGFASAAVAVLVGAVLFFIVGIVGLFPPSVQQAAVQALSLVGLILSAFGIHYTYQNLKA